MTGIKRVFLAAAAAAAQRCASACPLCHTATGDQVRAGIFNGYFVWNFLALLLPFPLFAAVVAWIHFGNRK